jgi:hypothetical protein
LRNEVDDDFVPRIVAIPTAYDVGERPIYRQFEPGQPLASRAGANSAHPDARKFDKLFLTMITAAAAGQTASRL